MNKNFYTDLRKNYVEKDYFDKKTITVNYYQVDDIINNRDRVYVISSLRTDSEEQKINKFINDCNKRLQSRIEESNPYSNKWQIFYLYKELFQFFSNEYNYFRGQPHDYPLLPGILRESGKSFDSKYRTDFENVYKELSNEFPEKIEYVNLGKNESNLSKRAYQLSLLQHYGLITSLLDVTQNPYIALLFMLSGDYQKYQEPAFYLFSIDDKEKSLFEQVKKNKANERIIAQKGAFLNFDKINLNEKNNLRKIPMIKIVLKFDNKAYEKIVQKDKDVISTINNFEEGGEYIEMTKQREEDIEKKKVRCIQNIKRELTDKLEEYFYFEEDLFPDFENRVQYLMRKYKSDKRKLTFE